MAAAVIPIVATVLGIVRPALPSIISWVEGLFGHSTTTGKKTGPQKTDAVIGVVQAVLTGLANSGLLPSAGVVDPAFQGELAKLVQDTVDAMNKSGLLSGQPAVPIVNVVPGAVTTNTPVVVPSLGQQPMTITIGGITLMVKAA